MNGRGGAGEGGNPILPQRENGTKRALARQPKPPFSLSFTFSSPVLGKY